MADRQVKAKEVKIGDFIRLVVEGKKYHGTIMDVKAGDDGELKLTIDYPDGGFMSRHYAADTEIILTDEAPTAPAGGITDDE